MHIKPEHVTVCGELCTSCSFLGQSCAGCLAQRGQMFWGTCNRFLCCTQERQLEHCGLCADLPCHWFDWNPEGFDADTFAAGRQRAINNLVRRREVGTPAWLAEQAQA